jgi:Fe-S cluster biogenesis protein NfuA
MSAAGDLNERVTRILREEIAPALGLDGNTLEVLAIDNGVARFRLGNVCCGCPSTLMAVIHGIERELRHRVPDIEYVEAVP